MRKLKIFFLAVLAISLGTMMGGCSKSNNNNSSSGTDSVLYSAWIKIAMTPDAGDTTFEQNIAVKAITQSILDKGTIMTYVGASNLVVPASDQYIFPTYGLGNLNLFAPYDASYTVTGLSVRYVIIPGKTVTSSVSGSLQTYTPTQLKGLSYATVAKLFNIPESGSTLK